MQQHECYTILRLFGIAEGNILRSKNDAGITNHGSHEGMKLNMVWDITSKDNLELDLSQYYTRNRASGADGVYDRGTHHLAMQGLTDWCRAAETTTHRMRWAYIIAPLTPL